MIMIDMIMMIIMMIIMIITIIIIITIIVGWNGLCCTHSAEIIAIKQGVVGISEHFIISIPNGSPMCTWEKTSNTVRS